MRIISCIVLLVILVSCEEPHEDVIDISEVMPSSNIDYDKDTIELKEDSLSGYRAYFKSIDSNMIDLELLIDKSFPDRFGPNSSWALNFYGKDTLEYRRWSYNDSAATVNAFFNWMDCYGKNCDSYYIGEPKNMQKNPFLILVGDTCMIYITGSTVNQSSWYTFLEDKGYPLNWHFIIEQNKWGKTNWFTFEENIKIPYENENS